MKISTIASVTIVGSTMAGSLMLSPVRQPVAPAAPAAPAAQTLPSTGLPVAISRIRHGLDLEAPASPTEIYEQYVPPLAPAPAPAPAPTPVRTAWAPSPGYTTIPVPIYRQTRNLNRETAALQMGLAYYGHYFSKDSLFAYENPDLRPAPWINGVLPWADPYTNFVGNVNGSESNLTGYGVYYPVILSIARS